METSEENKFEFDLRKASYKELCALWKLVIRMHSRGYKQKQIVEATGYKQRRVSEIIAKYKATKEIPKPKSRGRKPGEGKLLTPEQEREIKKLIIDKNPEQLKFSCFLWTANTVRELIFQKYSIKLGKQTMREYLESWGMSAQRPIKKAYHQDHTKTETFKKEVYPTIKKIAVEENAEIYFADETGINNQCYNPIGYAPRNNPPTVRVQTSRETVNMLSALSPSGSHKFMLYQETTTQQKLIEFMERLLKEKEKDKIFLFLDNLRVHHGKLVKAWVEEHETEISLYYFPSYSPEINPQEYLNNILKQNIHSGMPPRNKKEIQEKADAFMKSISKDKIRTIFEHPKLNYQKIN
jgi:transposase